MCTKNGSTCVAKLNHPLSLNLSPNTTMPSFFSGDAAMTGRVEKCSFKHATPSERIAGNYSLRLGLLSPRWLDGSHDRSELESLAEEKRGSAPSGNLPLGSYFFRLHFVFCKYCVVTGHDS